MKGLDLKHRMHGARETVKITRAMQLISASKMTKTEKRMESSREFFISMQRIKNKIGIVNHPFYKDNGGNRTVFVVVAGDKGLCGDYNHRVLEKAEDEIRLAKTVKVYAIGQYCREYFNKRNIRVSNAYIHSLQEPYTGDAKSLTDELAEMFLKKETDKAVIIYTHVPKEMRSAQHVEVKTLLPIEYPDKDEFWGIEKTNLESLKDVTDILKQYIWAQIYHGLCCAGYAVNFKRMTAMQQATTNGEKLVNELNVRYNHLRQESITTELIDAGTAKIAVRNMTGDGE